MTMLCNIRQALPTSDDCTERDNFVRLKNLVLQGAFHQAEIEEWWPIIKAANSSVIADYSTKEGTMEAGARRGCQGRPSLWPGGTLSGLQAAP